MRRRLAPGFSDWEAQQASEMSGDVSVSLSLLLGE